MNNLKTELIKNKANKILKYYNRENIKFNSALLDDKSSLKEREESFLFFKYKTQELSEEFARAVIDYDTTLDYHNMLASRLAFESVSKKSFFAKEIPANKKEVEETEFCVNLTKSVLNTFINKQDTPQFRKNVNKMNEVFSSDLNKVAEGDYGVIFFYRINSHPQFKPKNEMFLHQFSAQIKDQEQLLTQTTHEQQHER